MRSSHRQIPRIYETWEKRNWGGPRPTWRRGSNVLEKYPHLHTNEPLARSIRRVKNKRAKKMVGAA